MKFVDRGEETILDTSELLPLDQESQSIPAFAQQFRLNGYEQMVRLNILDIGLC